MAEHMEEEASYHHLADRGLIKTHTHSQVHTFTHSRTGMHWCTYMHSHKHIHTLTCTQVCSQACSHTHDIHTHVYTHVRECSCAHTLTHIHTDHWYLTVLHTHSWAHTFTSPPHFFTLLAACRVQSQTQLLWSFTALSKNHHSAPQWTSLQLTPILQWLRV